MEIRRTIKIKEKTYLKLRKKGMMGETFDDLLNRLMFEEKKKAKALDTKIANKCDKEATAIINEQQKCSDKIVDDIDALVWSSSIMN